jgi:hypothetical protein
MDNYLHFPVEDLAWMDGIDVSGNAWEKQGGAVKFNSAALTRDVALTNTSQNWTVAVASNVVTVDTISAHGYTVGSTLATDADWSDNAFMDSLSGKTILSTPTTHTFTFALTQANQGATTETSATAGMTATIPTAVVGLHDAWNSAPSGSPTVPEVTTQKLIVALAGATNGLKILDTDGTVLSSQNLAEASAYNPMVDINIRTTIRSQIMFSGGGFSGPLYTVPETYTLQSLAYPSADWSAGLFPHFGFTHNFRLLCFTKVSSILYMSNPKDHTEFANTRPNTRIMDVFPGEQHYIAGGVSWRGRAYLFKWERGIYFVDDSDTNLANWTTRKVTDAVGVAGPGCVVAYEDDVIFLGSDGYFYSLSTVQTLGQESVPPILPAEFGEFIRSEINVGALDLVRSTYYARKRQLWFALPATGTTTVNRRLIFDANLPGKIRVTWSERDEMPVLGTRRRSNVQEPIWGDSDGFVWVGDQATKSKAGAAYTSQFETPPVSLLPNGEQFGNLKELQVTFKPEGDYDLDMEVHGDSNLLQTLTVSQQVSGTPTGSWTMDADVLAGKVIRTSAHRLEGEARRVKLLGRNTEAAENFAVQQFNVRFTPGRHGL